MTDRLTDLTEIVEEIALDEQLSNESKEIIIWIIKESLYRAYPIDSPTLKKKLIDLGKNESTRANSARGR